jgi:hypothetical protein
MTKICYKFHVLALRMGDSNSSYKPFETAKIFLDAVWGTIGV